MFDASTPGDGFNPDGIFEDFFGQEKTDTEKADEAEALQRLRAQGLNPCSPVEAMANLVQRFPPTKDPLAIAKELKSLSNAELKQTMYEGQAASKGGAAMSHAAGIILYLRSIGALPPDPTEGKSE